MLLILASTSHYRRELLSRLHIPFDVDRPDVDESPLANETPSEQAQRLAEAKARAVAHRHPNAWVIGSDQVAELNGQAIGKPGNMERAATQLQNSSGQRVVFHTACCLYRYSDDQIQRFDDKTTVHFRVLSENEIERYLCTEQPYDCAGSFKAEGLGITLFKEIESRDPTALIGLPLIGLANALRNIGFHTP